MNNVEPRPPELLRHLATLDWVTAYIDTEFREVMRDMSEDLGHEEFFQAVSFGVAFDTGGHLVIVKPSEFGGWPQRVSIAKACRQLADWQEDGSYEISTTDVATSHVSAMVRFLRLIAKSV